jgi:5-methylthioadenosine/S-adenosylhomocysteine deaminase
MFLGDGITRIKEMLEAGITISLGTDGGCSNNRASIVEEMRMTSLLQKVKHCNSTVTTAEQMFELGTVNGGKNLNLPLGKLEPGCAGDFVVIDLEDLSMQPRQHATKNLVYSMMPSALQAVYVAGRKVYEMGEILTMPESQIVEKVRTLTADWV